MKSMIKKLLPKLTNSFLVVLSIVIIIAGILSPWAVGSYLDKNQHLEYKQYVVVDKDVAINKHKSSYSSGFTMVVKDVKTNVYESKVVDTNTYYTYEKGTIVEFVDESKKVNYNFFGFMITLLILFLFIAEFIFED